MLEVENRPFALRRVVQGIGGQHEEVSVELFHLECGVESPLPRQ